MKYRLLKEAALREMMDDDGMEPSHGDGLLHVFDYGEDCPFADRFVVILPNGDTYHASADAHMPNGHGVYEGETDYTTRQEMEDNLTVEWRGTEITPMEVEDISSLPRGLRVFIKQRMEEDGGGGRV